MCLFFKRKENSLYNPQGPAPCPAATIVELQTPKLCSNRPQGQVSVGDCFLLYPSQLEGGRGGEEKYVPLSNPMDAPLPLSLPPASLHHKP